ncbi:hypothetical protein L3Q67_45295 (plasmid) [Saccharothrix sp. AJ9571]|nr:hypothetical protein L3Q67_45295 [Saccharothrix sp. AJ9571]
MSAAGETPWSSLPPEEEARRIGSVFDGWHSGLDPWEWAGSPKGQWGLARVCRVMPQRVLHVIGASAMAERLRELLGTGVVTGWSLQPMPPSRTPLADYHAQFRALPQSEGGVRGFKQLTNAGFAFGEEVAACPDEVLLRERNIGPNTLARIRRIVGGPPPPPEVLATRIDIDANGTSAPVADPQRLKPFDQLTRTRYPALVRGLAVSAMPASALTAIAHSLAAEALPPAEQLVELLLETAGEHQLLELYRQTHR